VTGVLIAYLDKNYVRYSPGSFINFPPKYKNRLYKSIVKFMSSVFLQQARDVKSQYGTSTFAAFDQKLHLQSHC